MLKRTVLASGALLLLLGLVFGRDTFSYVLTSAGRVHRTVRESVPVTFELERARKMIAALEPEIGRHKREIAREELDLRKLDERLGRDREDVAGLWRDIQRLRDDLSRGDSNFVYAGRTYTARQVENDLTNRFERYQTREATLQNMEKILEARRRGLEAAQEKLKAMIASKRQLEVEIENLEARLKMVEVAKAASDFHIDDSQLSRTRQLLSDIKTRIEVDAQLVHADDVLVDEIKLEHPEDHVSILERITEYEAGRDGTPASYVGVRVKD
jgi:predicted  nucleic acid-binding Zn-ribbon protein